MKKKVKSKHLPPVTNLYEFHISITPFSSNPSLRHKVLTWKVNIQLLFWQPKYQNAFLSSVHKLKSLNGGKYVTITTLFC